MWRRSATHPCPSPRAPPSIHQQSIKDNIPQAVLDRFIESQLAGDIQAQTEGAKDEPWFHGMLGREEAEARLAGTHPGTFMLRASKSRNGLSLSIQTETEGFKHFLVNFKPNAGYYIVGKKKAFATMADLVQYYMTQPVRSKGTVLVFPCPRPAASAEETAYRETLYVDLLASELNAEVMNQVEQMGQQQADRKQTTRNRPAPYETWQFGDGTLSAPVQVEAAVETSPPPGKTSPGQPGSTYIGPPLPVRSNTISVR